MTNVMGSSERIKVFSTAHQMPPQKVYQKQKTFLSQGAQEPIYGLSDKSLYASCQFETSSNCASCADVRVISSAAKLGFSAHVAGQPARVIVGGVKKVAAALYEGIHESKGGPFVRCPAPLHCAKAQV
jgi:hypothetical protein